LQKVKPLIKLLHGEMEKFRDLPFVGDVRCLGMVAAIELVRDKQTKEPFAIKERVGQRIFERGLKEHLLLRPLGNITYLFLPLCVTELQLCDILKKTYKVLNDFGRTIRQ
jgi:adenosylmethionine-8-amino-7-oxononanoate aminotransferase